MRWLAPVGLTVALCLAGRDFYPDAHAEPTDPIADLVSRVEISELEEVATNLVTRFGPRHPSSSRPFVDDHCTPSSIEYPKNNLDMASDYVGSAFEAMGYPVEMEEIALDGGDTGYNVIATRLGSVDPTKYIEIGAHIDTVASTPGAGDNASGAAALVEIARVLKDYASGHSIRFIAHVGEESRQTGSNQHLDGVLARGERVKAGLIMDGIGWSEIAPAPMNCIWQNEDPETRRIAQMFDSVRADYGIDIAWRTCAPTNQTADNVAYWTRGFPATLSIGGFPYEAPAYHGCGDTMDTVDLHNVLLTAQQNLAVLLRLDAEAEPTWWQTDWSGGAGQTIWADPTRFESSSGLDDSRAGHLSLNRISEGDVLFEEKFAGGPDGGDPLEGWTIQSGEFEVAEGVLRNVVPPTGYAVAYADADAGWTDYSVAGRFKIPIDGFAACIGGRLTAATGQHYSACVYAANRLVLIDMQNWDMVWQPIAEVGLPPVGADWHSLKLAFVGNTIRVYYDDELAIEVANDLYSAGGVSVLTWTGQVPADGFGAAFDDIEVRLPDNYVERGRLLSSAFDGGPGARWRSVSWSAASADESAVRVRTRSGERLTDLSRGEWSSWLAASGSPVSDALGRWMQYEVELTSGAVGATPVLRDIEVTYEVAATSIVDTYLPSISR